MLALSGCMTTLYLCLHDYLVCLSMACFDHLLLKGVSCLGTGLFYIVLQAGQHC